MNSKWTDNHLPKTQSPFLCFENFNDYMFTYLVCFWYVHQYVMGGITTEYDIDIKTDKEKKHVKEFVINLFMTSIWYYNLCGYVVKVKNRNVA